MGVPSRTSALTPAPDQTNWDFQIILGKVRPFTSPGRGPSTSSDHCSSATVPSVKAARDPDLTTIPVAVNSPLEGRTALRKLTLISIEVKPLPFGIVLCTAQPIAVSSSVQTRPPQTAPTAL